VSVAVAETALLPAVRAAVGESGESATILADGFSCRTQLDQLADVRGTHLAELLAARLPAPDPGPAGTGPRKRSWKVFFRRKFRVRRARFPSPRK
jgi:hypothetical protein